MYPSAIREARKPFTYLIIMLDDVLIFFLSHFLAFRRIYHPVSLALIMIKPLCRESAAVFKTTRF